MFILKYIFPLYIIAIHVRSSNSTKTIELMKLSESVTGNANVFDKKCTYRTNSSATVKNFGLQFQLPFIDMAIEHKHNLHLAQEETNNQLYIIHGHELYLMELSNEQKHFILIGLLTGSLVEKDVLGVKIIIWRGYLLLIIAMADELEIYQVENILIKNRVAIAGDKIKFAKEAVPRFDPIQQLVLTGKYRKHMVIMHKEERIMLLVAENFTKMWDKQRSFEWLGTYFEPIEELTTSPISTYKLIGTEPKYLIVGRIARSSKTKSALSMYEIQLPSLKLKRKQTLTVLSCNVHAFTYHSKNYLITCGLSQTKCNSFRMINGQFEVYKQRGSQELGFNLMKAASHFLVGVRKNEVRIYGHARLDCYTSFKSNLTDVVAIFAHANAKGEEFVVLHYRQMSNSLLRLAEIKAEGGMMLGALMANVTDNDDTNDITKHVHHFEDSIGELRSILLKRKSSMSTFRRMANLLSPKMSTIKLPKPVHIRSGHIRLVKLIAKTINSPLQILQRVEHFRQVLQPPQKRLPRSFTVTGQNVTLLQLQHIKVRNLRYKGDILSGFYVDNKKQLFARQKVRTKSLVAKMITTRTTHLRHGRHLDINSTLNVLSLNVKKINGMHWTNLYEELYLKNRNIKIHGNLTLNKSVKVGNMRTLVLNDVPVDHFFNMKYPQVIYSNIFIPRFLVRKIQSNRINNIDLTRDLVLRGQNVLIEGPVVLHQAKIRSDIFHDYNHTEKQQFQHLNAYRNIELQQYYTEKVIINGSLTINKLWSESEAAVVLVNGKKVTVKTIQQNFVLNNSMQFVQQRVAFDIEAKLTTPALHVQQLNEWGIHEHLLNIPVQQSAQLNVPPILMFASAKINVGDVNSPNKSSKLHEISKQVVHLGSAANITGSKLFEKAIMVDRIYTLTMNHLPVNEFVRKSDLVKDGEIITFSGNKLFKTISVTDGVTVSQGINASYLNNLVLNTFLHYNYFFKMFSMPYTLYVEKVIFDRINSKPFSEIFKQLQIHDGKLTLHKGLRIEGNARFVKPLHVQYVNGIEWESYARNLVRSNEDMAVIIDQKRFLNDLTVTGILRTHLLNAYNLSEALQHVLLKSKPQQLTGAFTFSYLNSSNLDISVINGMSTSAFLNLSSTEFLIADNLNVPQLTVLGNMFGLWQHSFDILSVFPRLAALLQYDWHNLNVVNNVSWTSAKADAVLPAWQQKFLYLQQYAVQRIGHHNITGNVRLHSPYILKARMKPNFAAATELNVIANDALRKQNNKTQIVKSPKNFLNSLFIRNLQTNRVLNVELLNEIDIILFNRSLWRMSVNSPIAGPLHFKRSVHVTYLCLNGSINEIQPGKIYNDRTKRLPAVRIQQLSVTGKIQLDYINGVRLQYLLENHVKKNDHLPTKMNGKLTFEHLKLGNSALIQSINDISIDNILLYHSELLQTVAGTTNVNGDLILVGPAHVLWLNDEYLTDAYHHSVLTDNNHNYKFKHIIADLASFENGLLQPTPSFYVEGRALNEDITEETRLKLPQQHFIYLDYDSNMKIHWKDVNETDRCHQHFYELETRVSPCKRRLLLMQCINNAQTIFLQNVTTNTMVVGSDNIVVKVENYCKPRYDKVYSKIELVTEKVTKVYGMKKHIETVMTFIYEDNVFVLLHALGVTNIQNEIHILRLDTAHESIKVWQRIACGVGKKVHLLKAITLKPSIKPVVLLVISGLLKDRPVLSIYVFTEQSQKFMLSQTIEGNYDNMQLMEMQEGGQQLILGCRQCERFTVYARESAAQKFSIKQTVELIASMDRLLLFSPGKNQWYLLGLSRNEQDNYHVYKYTSSRGWFYAGHSYYPNIHLALPLITDNHWAQKSLLLLLCGNGKNCGVVRAKLRYN